jgi:hypothetical protein
MSRSLTIASAVDGGFVVITAPQAGALKDIVFAGSMFDCLDYIARKMGAHSESWAGGALGQVTPDEIARRLGEDGAVGHAQNAPSPV